MTVNVRLDCLHFRGDRPCVPHKREGVRCEGCPHHVPVKTRLLMIKLDAMGDVLRTTCLLPGLAARYEDPQLTWITGAPSVDLLRNNPYVHRVVAAGDEALSVLATEEFDVVVNLDAAPRSARLATLARARQKLGYLYDPKGYTYPAGERASRWFEMGLFDDVKRANRRSFQELMCEIVQIPPASCRYVFELSPDERRFGEDWARQHGLPVGPEGGACPVIGLNTGAGGRWQHKRWRFEGYRDLARRLAAEPGARIVLLGGDEELEYNRRLAAECPGAVVSGSHPVRRFASIVARCDLVVAGDTLGLHLALAVGRPVVALFGPTSADEIELFGLGEKIVPRIDCLGCYRERCDVAPTCMDLIRVDDVLEAVRRVLGN